MLQQDQRRNDLHSLNLDSLEWSDRYMPLNFDDFILNNYGKCDNFSLGSNSFPLLVL